MSIIDKIIGTHSERELKRIQSTVDKIESLQPEMKKLSDDALKAKTEEFKKRFSAGVELERLAVAI